MLSKFEISRFIMNIFNSNTEENSDIKKIINDFKSFLLNHSFNNINWLIV